MDINDSVVLVTGGNRGLGKALVQAFLGAGAPKTSPEDVAARIIEGIHNDQEEVLADQMSHEIKAVLASNPQMFYQGLQADWDNALQSV